MVMESPYASDLNRLVLCSQSSLVGHYERGLTLAVNNVL